MGLMMRKDNVSTSIEIDENKNVVGIVCDACGVYVSSPVSYTKPEAEKVYKEANWVIIWHPRSKMRKDILGCFCPVCWKIYVRIVETVGVG